MTLTITNFPNWVPSGGLRRGLVGSKLIAVDTLINVGSRRFVVWDLATDVRDAFEVTFDTGYEPNTYGFYVGTHCVTADANGLWVPNRGTNGYWYMTRFNPDGSFDQFPSTTPVELYTYIYTSGNRIWAVRVGSEIHTIAWSSSSSWMNVTVFDTSTLTWEATGTNIGSSSLLPGAKPIIQGGYAYWVRGTSVVRYDPSTRTCAAVATASAAITINENATPVEYGGDIWWSGNNKFLKYDGTGTAPVITSPVPTGSALTEWDGDLITGASGAVSGYNPTTTASWTDGATPFGTNTLLVHGGNLIGLP